MKKLLLVLGMLTFSACGKEVPTAPANQTYIVTATQVGQWFPAFMYNVNVSVGDVINLAGTMYLPASDSVPKFTVGTDTDPNVVTINYESQSLLGKNADFAGDNVWLVSFTVTVNHPTPLLGERIYVYSASSPVDNRLVSMLTVK
jgi:hypothetical protein